ncbi:hypothetical protein PgNI_05252 [Pyricularia grisea]|uniref:Uncharacterized protein n=1 Tax=Pyricularia grisea TaxID=148305 RepID=A0A6P8B5L9_PYRGI|nr:hypothetical protein PgNI_05252 [Pyricularia grisea]TLD10573.1 hypothetical protein PgNI_05252 [Pyricularia grisea]
MSWSLSRPAQPGVAYGWLRSPRWSTLDLGTFGGNEAQSNGNVEQGGTTETTGHLINNPVFPEDWTSGTSRAVMKDCIDGWVIYAAKPSAFWARDTTSRYGQKLRRTAACVVGDSASMNCCELTHSVPVAT